MRYKRFFIAFLSTMLLSGTVCGLVFVDFTLAESGFRGFSNGFSAQRQGDKLLLNWPAGTVEWDLTKLNQSVQLRREYSHLSPLPALRLMERYLVAGLLELKSTQKQQKEQDYKKNAGLV